MSKSRCPDDECMNFGSDDPKFDHDVDLDYTKFPESPERFFERIGKDFTHAELQPYPDENSFENLFC